MFTDIMNTANDRGQYNVFPGAGGNGSKLAWWIGGAGLLAVGLAVFKNYSQQTRPQLTAHEKEVKAWEAEFPGLPWYMDQVKDAKQLDMWERARDHWERTR